MLNIGMPPICSCRNRRLASAFAADFAAAGSKVSSKKNLLRTTEGGEKS